MIPRKRSNYIKNIRPNFGLYNKQHNLAKYIGFLLIPSRIKLSSSFHQYIPELNKKKVSLYTKLSII